MLVGVSDRPVRTHGAEVAGDFQLLNNPDDANEHFVREQARLYPDAVCGLIVCPSANDASCISDEQILLLWQCIVSVIGARSWALIDLCRRPRDVWR